MRNRLGMTLATAVVLLGASASAGAREVSVNGEPLDLLGLALVDALNCGETVPDGRYWVDFESGAWGYEGGPQQGVLDCEAPAAEQAQTSDDQGGFWEDRMCSQYGLCGL
jgi:hypothetical protein